MFDIVDFVKDINWKDTDNVIGNILKGTIKTLDRPLGAVEGALSNFPDFRDIFDDPKGFARDYAHMYEGAYQGFKEPDKYNTRDIGLVDEGIRRLPKKYQGIAEIGAETALDPLTYLGGIGLVGKGKKLGPVGKLFLEPVLDSPSITKRLGAEYAVNAGARLGGEAGRELTEGTPFQTAGTIGGGLIGGGLTARTLSARNAPRTMAKYNSMVEEQLHEGNIFEYLDSLSKEPDSIESVSGLVFKRENYEPELWTKLVTEAKPLSEGDFAIWKPFKSQYDLELEKLYAAEPETVEIDFNNTKFIERNVIPIPLNHAIKDELLDNSHNEFTTRFYDNEFKDSSDPIKQKVRTALVNWVEDTSLPQSQLIRQAIKEGLPEGQVIYDIGNDFRSWANSLTPEQVAASPVFRDVNGSRYIFLHRGEENPLYRLPDGKLARETSNFGELEVREELTGDFVLYKRDSLLEDKYVSDNGEVIWVDDIQKAENVTLPLWEKDQIVESYSSNPERYKNSKWFIGEGQDYINPDTGLKEKGKFILGRWVPVDDIIGPVGKNSNEHEFLVINRDTISDDAYERITGHAKDAPRQAQYTVTRQVEDTNLPKAELVYESNNPKGPASEKFANPAIYFWEDSDGDVWKTTKYSDGKLGEPQNVSWKVAGTDAVLEQHYDTPYADIYRGAPDEIRFKQEKLSFPDEESALKAINGEGQITQSITGGYSKDLAEVRQLEIPRKTDKITTGSGYEVDYSKPLAEPEKPKTAGEKLLDALLGNNAQQANIVNPVNKAKSILKLKSSNKASNVLAANITQPHIPTPSPQQVVNNIPPMFTKDIVNSMLSTKGIDPKIATTLSSLSKKQRADLADAIVNNLALKGPQEDVVRTVINGFQKAGKGDPSKLIMANNAARGVWASMDGSWFGIQGLLSIPHMLVTGRIGDVGDVIFTSMRTMAGDKEAFRKYVARTLENLPAGAPTLNEAVNAGLHLSTLKGNQDINFNIAERLTGNRFQPDAAFATAGDVARISEFYNTWRRYKNTPNLDLSEIARAVNRGTGIAEKPFGGYFGSVALFAPRFFQSQLEVIAKSFTDGGIEGNLARRQMISLLGTGIALTVAANEARGYDTTFDPRDPNFLRIRNVAGQDVSVFGPWDSLAKLIINVGSGDFSYARTKFSPLMTVMTNLMMGETFRGEPFPPTGNPLQITGNLAKSLLLPFAWQDLGEGGVTGTALNFFGVKNSPLSNSEKIDANMVNLGLDPNDPLARRQFLADHPEMRKLTSERAKDIDEIKTNIKGRSLDNEERVRSGEISLVDFRDARKILSRESRNKIDLLTQGQDFKADTQQKRWIEGYYSLYDKAQDPVTHDIVGSTFDKLEADWIAANGQGAYNYVQEYLGVGKNPIELQYLNDMKQLDQLGYFDIPKYTPDIYASGLTDDQIEDYRTRVSNARNVNALLGDMDYEDAVFEVLGGELPPQQLFAIADAGKSISQNPAVDDIKTLYPHLFLWFNPKATWSMYQDMKALTPEELQMRALLSS